MPYRECQISLFFQNIEQKLFMLANLFCMENRVCRESKRESPSDAFFFLSNCSQEMNIIWGYNG